MNALLFSLPGTPVIYYGDEIGMGDNVYLGDRNGVRTPMQWSADRNAGFSRANPQRLYLPVNIDPEYHYEAVNVETQQRNPHSLLWWMKRLIAQRKQFRAFGRGSLEFLYPSNRKVLAFFRQFDDERILVVANLSRFSQGVELDLQKFQGAMLQEIFGVTRFPPITQEPYFLSLAPYSFYWFKMLPKEADEELVTEGEGPAQIATIAAESMKSIWSESTLDSIAQILPRLLRERRWFLGRNRTITGIVIDDVIPLRRQDVAILLIRVEYSDGEDHQYTIPLAVAEGVQAEEILRDQKQTVLARLEFRDQSWVLLYSALIEWTFSDALLTAVLKRSKFKGTRGEMVAGHTKAFRDVWAHMRSNREPQVQSVDSPNTFVNLGEDFVVKLYRKVEPGTNPDREVEEFLTERTNFAHIPKALGWFEYCVRQAEDVQRTTLGLLTSYVRDATPGWQFTIDHLSLYFERALAVQDEDARAKEVINGSPLTLVQSPAPPLMAELLGAVENMAHLLGVRTAELHEALSCRPEVYEFSPEPFTDFYRHGLYHGMLGQMGRSLDALRLRLKTFPQELRAMAEELLASEAAIRNGVLPLRDQRILRGTHPDSWGLPAQQPAVYRQRCNHSKF